MKGKSQQRAIFVQVGRALTQQKPKNRKQVYSLYQVNTQNSKPPNGTTAVQFNQNPLPAKRKTTVQYPPKINSNSLISGMNDQFLFMRKQNHLNSCFNVRKNKLKQISRENKEIHKRLNSQKSIYSSTDFDKSFEQISGIKKRLSQSKMSRLNSSRSSSRGNINTSQNKRYPIKKKEPIQIKASSINDAKAKDLKSFQALFVDKPKAKLLKQSKVPQQSAYNTIKKLDEHPHSVSESYRNTVPAIANDHQREVPKNMGGILHRIAEVMYSGEEKVPSKTSKGYMKPKKTFIF